MTQLFWRDGYLRARSMGDMARYTVGYNWRLKHMSFVDVRDLLGKSLKELDQMLQLHIKPDGGLF